MRDPGAHHHAPWRRAAAGVALGLGLTATSAHAQGNYRSTPNGGRSALMGNTGVALGHDGAAPFLNPATIVRIHDARLAFSVNFYTFTATHFSAWHQPGAVDGSHFGALQLGGTSTTSDRFDAVPATLCLFFTVAGVGESDADRKKEAREGDATRRGRQKLAVCLGNVERQQINLNALNFRSAIPTGYTQQAQSMSLSWTQLHIGPSYAAYLTNDLAFGISFHGVVTTYGYAAEGSNATTAPGGTIASTLGAAGEGYSIDHAIIVGLSYRLGPATLGLSGQIPALHLTGGYNANLHSEVVAASGDSVALTTGKGDFAAPPPARLAMGAGLELARLKAEVDATYFFPTTTALKTVLHVDQTSVIGGATTPSALDATYTAAARPVIDLAAGAEYFVTPTFSLLAGVSTDFSSTRALVPTMTLADLSRARTDRVMVSLGAGTYGDGDVLIGTELSYGWGEILAVNPYVLPNAFTPVQMQTYGVMLVVAGSTSLRAIGRAVTHVEDLILQKKTAEPPSP